MSVEEGAGGGLGTAAEHEEVLAGESEEAVGEGTGVPFFTGAAGVHPAEFLSLGESTLAMSGMKL